MTGLRLIQYSHFVIALFLLTISNGGVVANEPDLEISELQKKIVRYADNFSGDVAIAIQRLPDGDPVLINADQPMKTASLIKVAVMIEAYRQIEQGQLTLDKMLTLQKRDKVPGSGILTSHFSPGTKLSLKDAIRLMMAYSDNTATNLVIDQVGLEEINKTMNELGFSDTQIYSKVYRGSTTTIAPERSKKFGLGSTTAKEMLGILTGLNSATFSSKKMNEEMLQHMRECINEDRIPALLPPRTVVAQKTGSISSARTVAGIIESPNGPIVVVILTAKDDQGNWSNRETTDQFMARISKAAFDHFNPQIDPDDQAPRQLEEGASGWLVEALQRTLNDRMAPSPDLSIDGEFGPVTKKALIAFQEKNGLPATGVADKAVWETLGPLLTNDLVITDPKEFDLKLPEKKLLDELSGQPYVTCKAWIVGNADSQEVVGSFNKDRRLENASTTKLMTAYIAIREIKKDPTLLNVLATVSSRAAKTRGSTAKVQTGESLKVGDLLYGLLLPSGNDASVVLAEHLGDRFEPPSDNIETDDPLAKFVAEMNRVAKELGMTNTSFRNPHGLSDPEHKTTVSDLFKLASAISSDGSLLPYVQTRKYVGELTGASGYKRYELWTNTNRLLNIDGYLGMKTGTTSRAGACLVSLGERNGAQLITVILGSSSSDARYTDTRNLFRWAWNEIEQKED